MALLTAAQFREHFPQISGVSEDPLFLTFVARADALMAGFLGFPEPDTGSRTLASATYTLYLDAPSMQHPQAMCLCVRPVVSVTSVHIDPDSADSAGWTYGASTLVDSDDYVIDNKRGELWLRSSSDYTWPSAPRGTKVVVVAGYATTPADLVAICATATRHLWDLRHVQGVEGYTVLGDSATRADAEALLPQSVRDALAVFACGGKPAAVAA